MHDPQSTTPLVSPLNGVLRLPIINYILFDDDDDVKRIIQRRRRKVVSSSRER